jgi:xanthine dehydrogenase accessory factor
MIANLAWPDALHAAIARGERAVIVAVAGAAGSTPRESGAAMVVTRDRIAGTIGGGHLEYEATRIAREALVGNAAVSAHWLVRFPLAARLGQCCGGVATLAFAVVDASAATWLDGVAALARAAAPFALVGRLGHGDAVAARLVVTADGAMGTLGETRLDAAAVAAARARLGRRPVEASGGSGALDLAGVPLFVHVFQPVAFAVCVFGNGHVGRALVQVLGALPASVQWYDTREHDFPAGVPDNVEVVATDAPAGDVENLPTGAYVVVMTHSHALDFDIVEAALRRDDWRYLGLIGSRAKRHQLERRLAARGVAPAVVSRVICPIGRGDLKSKEPGVIAVAVAAEILAIREAMAAGACAGTTIPPPAATQADPRQAG